MRVGILGINYKSSDLVLHELLAKACQRRLRNDSQEATHFSSVLLSTCNRTEVYFSAADLAEAHSEILNLLREEIACPFEHRVYSYFGSDCFMHLARVAAGLDSAIVAETEIQRQVKTAYAQAVFDHSLTSHMHFLFQKALKASKSIRSMFPLPRGTPSLEGVIFDECKHLKNPSVFFVGNSEINRKMISFFKRKGVEALTLCTRSVHSAQELQIDVCSWFSLDAWQKHDVVICGSNYPDYLIFPEQLDAGAKTRFIFDLSMPRTVDPRMQRHPRIHLLNIEELGHLIAATRNHHLQGMQQAEVFLQQCISKQVELFHIKENKSFLCA